jgi:sec-independent protein translocase protein TatC
MTRESREMPFLEHLEELRRRLIISIGSILILSIAGYFVSDYVLNFITRPVDEVYFMGVAEAFGVKIKISLFIGLFLSVPIIFYQLWQFVAPGLYQKEIALILPVVLAMSFFFIAGASFCFYLVLPIGIKFLLGFGTEKLKPLLSVGKYVSFVGWMTVAFGAVFELPVVTYVLGKLGIVDAPMLRRGRRFAVLGILVVSAVATPSPDMFSQVLLAVPLYSLYEISIILVALTGKKRGISDAGMVSDV